MCMCVYIYIYMYIGGLAEIRKHRKQSTVTIISRLGYGCLLSAMVICMYVCIQTPPPYYNPPQDIIESVIYIECITYLLHV